jgi:hypothetical protein
LEAIVAGSFCWLVASVTLDDQEIVVVCYEGHRNDSQKTRRYWHSQRFPAARLWAKPIGERFEKIGSYELYRVASDLVNGWLPRYLEHVNVSSLHPERRRPGWKALG